MSDHQADDARVKRALMAGILANLGVAVVKFVAYSATRSAAMLAESLHSVADSTNQLLLLVGLIRSKRPANAEHPFGHGPERYFWAFVVSVNVFFVGAAVSIYEGIKKILHPHAIEQVSWSYVAIAAGLILEGFALRVAWREFQHFRKQEPGPLLQQLRETKNLALPTVLFEDTAALVGLLIAAVGITAAYVTGDGRWDGAASVCIGLVLLVVAAFLARESHSLLIGEATGRTARRRLREVVRKDPAVVRLIGLKTLQRGPDEVLVAVDVKFEPDLDTKEVEAATRRVEAAIREILPSAKHIYVEAYSKRK